MVVTLILSLIIITLVNVIAYVWAYKKQSDHLTDISYSLSFIALVVSLVMISGHMSWQHLILVGMVVLWGLRLGGFLFYRINKMGKDDRFDSFRGSWIGFLKFFLLQSISIWIIALPAIIFIQVPEIKVSIVGIGIWFIGFVVEAIADAQKFSFKEKHPDRYMDSGIYKKIRHPNYLGEILCWLGIWIYIAPSIVGWYWISIISPIWICLLLIKISGIPLLEKKGYRKYGEDPEYMHYMNHTHKLIPGIY